MCGNNQSAHKLNWRSSRSVLLYSKCSRKALAVALANCPALLLLDDPLASLDCRAEQIWLACWL